MDAARVIFLTPKHFLSGTRRRQRRLRKKCPKIPLLEKSVQKYSCSKKVRKKTVIMKSAHDIISRFLNPYHI